MSHGSPFPFPSARERAVLAIHEAVAAGRMHVVHRRRHRHGLARLNLAGSCIRDTLRSLHARDIRAGPLCDHHDHAREVWVFGPVIESVEMYVKVAIGRTSPGGLPQVVVWSFHPAMHPMRAASDEGRDA